MLRYIHQYSVEWCFSSKKCKIREFFNRWALVQFAVLICKISIQFIEHLDIHKKKHLRLSICPMGKKSSLLHKIYCKRQNSLKIVFSHTKKNNSLRCVDDSNWFSFMPSNGWLYLNQQKKKNKFKLNRKNDN